MITRKTLIEKIVMILTSCFILASIVFLEFYFIEKSLFEYFPNIGIAFHFFGGFCVSVIVYYTFIKSLVKLEWYLIVMFLVGTVCLAAIGWEGFEWVLGRITGSLYQATLDNTMEDLFVGLTGGVFSCPLLVMRNSSIAKYISIKKEQSGHILA